MTVLKTDVSRETFGRLEAFVALVQKWTSKINLISRHTVDEIWERHIEDSAQIYRLAPKFQSWVDLGSGGGFPGIVVAILVLEDDQDRKITLVESDLRKATFLRTAIRELGLTAEVISKRIEDIPPLGADVLSARALAELDVLLGFADRHLKPGGTALFPKGSLWETEHAKAQKQWSYTCDPIRSMTNPEAAILKIKDITRV